MPWWNGIQERQIWVQNFVRDWEATWRVASGMGRDTLSNDATVGRLERPGGSMLHGTNDAMTLELLGLILPQGIQVHAPFEDDTSVPWGDDSVDF